MPTTILYIPLVKGANAGEQPKERYVRANLQKGFGIVCVGAVGEDIGLWYAADPAQETEEQEFVIFDTGTPMVVPGKGMIEYKGTAIMSNHSWHVFFHIRPPTPIILPSGLRRKKLLEN